MCLRFKAENLNQQQLIEQLPKAICKSIRQHLFLPTVEKAYLFQGVSKEILLLLVWILLLYLDFAMSQWKLSQDRHVDIDGFQFSLINLQSLHRDWDFTR